MLIIGIGQAGCSFVSRCADKYSDKADYVAIDTDKLTINLCRATDKLLISKDERLVSSGNIPYAIGRASFCEANLEIERLLEKHKSDEVVVVAGAAGCGGGIAPSVAGLAKDLGMKVKAVTFMPFSYEPRNKIESTNQSLNAYREFGIESVNKVDNNKCLEMGDGLALYEAMGKLDDEVIEELFAIQEKGEPYGYYDGIPEHIRNMSLEELEKAIEEERKKVVTSCLEEEGD